MTAKTKKSIRKVVGPSDPWKHRRRMAWIAFGSAVALIFFLVGGTLAGILDVKVIAALSVPIGGFLTWTGVIITNYITAVTYQDTKLGGK